MKSAPTLYLEHLRNVRRCSAYTVRNYRTALRFFNRYCQQAGETLESATPLLVSDFVRHEAERKTPQTVNGYITAIREFYRFTSAFLGWQNDPTRGVKPCKTAKRLPRWIDSQTLCDILAQPAHGFQAERGRLATALLFGLGLRCAELCALQVSAFDWHSGFVDIIGKGDKERAIPFNQTLLNDVRTYIDRHHVTGYLLQTVDGQPLTPYQLRQVLAHYLRGKVSPDLAHPHVLRHSYATALVNGGAPLIAVQHLLGHASIKTTEKYAHVNYRNLQQVYADHFPR